MASLASRSFLRFLRRASNNPLIANQKKRNLSASAHDDAYETAKWEKITYAGIVGCTALATYLLSKGHPHYDEQPAYSYLHIRNKEFPWGLWMTPFLVDVSSHKHLTLKQREDSERIDIMLATIVEVFSSTRFSCALLLLVE